MNVKHIKLDEGECQPRRQRSWPNVCENGKKKDSSKTMETTIFSSTCNGRSIPRPLVTKVNKMKYRSIIYTSHV